MSRNTAVPKDDCGEQCQQPTHRGISTLTNRQAMRVLYLTKRLAEVSDEEGRVREISKLGVQMSVVVPAGRWRGPTNAAEKLNPQGYELSIHGCCFTKINAVRVRCHIYYFPGISRVIGREKWDVVHIEEEPYNLATYQVVKECARYKRPAIFLTAKMVLRNYPLPFNYFEKYVYRNASAALAINCSALDILRRKGFMKRAALLSQDGVDPAVFRKVEASSVRQRMRLNGGFMIGFVGQVAYRKGLDILIRALALLPRECVLVLVGSGPGVPRLQSLAKRLGVSERVQWVPWVNHRDIVGYMSAFDVFVLPSRTLSGWREDFGRVLIEAMACETPVVGSDSGEIPNVIGDAGLIFHEGDEHELAAHLRRLREESSLRETLGRRGRERVLEHFTYEKVAKATVEFYKQVCSG